MLDRKITTIYLESCTSLSMALADYLTIAESDSDGRKLFLKVRLEAAIINNDLTMIMFSIVNYKLNQDGFLVLIANAIHKMFETKEWLHKRGNPKLRELAVLKNCTMELDEQIKGLKAIGLPSVDEFMRFRDSLSGHYLNDMTDKFCELRLLPEDKFKIAFSKTSQYLLEWIKLLAWVGKIEPV